jgi:hypothetical protein
VFLGLSRLNTEKLLNNQPIRIRLRDMHPELPDLVIILMGGETEADLAEDLRAVAPNVFDREPGERQ